MSKVFQIFGGFVYTQITGYRTAEEASRNFAPDIQIVDAPDNVFEGWGYDETKTGDARFIQPVPSDGWLYDTDTGMFYQEGGERPSHPVAPKPTEEKIADLEAAIAALQQGGGSGGSDESAAILAAIERGLSLYGEQ